MNELKIETFPMGSLLCNCSFIYSKNTKEAIIIDPGNDADGLLKKIEERDLKVKILLHTHAHFDHIGCSKTIKEKLNVPVYLHKGDNLLYKALPAQAIMFGFPPSLATKVDHFIEDEEEYSLNDQNLKNFLKALYTPGHTEGSCCFYTEAFDVPFLFSGDTLFQSSIGRTDLPGGDYSKIIKSIKERLYILPEETKVVTGHGPETQIYNERKYNPFVNG